MQLQIRLGYRCLGLDRLVVLGSRGSALVLALLGTWAAASVLVISAAVKWRDERELKMPREQEVLRISLLLAVMVMMGEGVLFVGMRLGKLVRLLGNLPRSVR